MVQSMLEHHDNADFDYAKPDQIKDDVKMTVGYLRVFPYDEGNSTGDLKTNMNNGRYYWPDYYFPKQDDRTAQAFRIVQKLMEKGYVKNVTVKKFVELVNELAGEL